MTLRALVSGTTCLLNLTQRGSLRAQPLVGLQWRTHGRIGPDRSTRRLLTTAYGREQQRSYTRSAVADLTSTSNEYVKHCCKLRTTLKYRQACGRVLVVGKGLLEEIASLSGGAGRLHIHTMLLAQGVSYPVGVQADKIYTVTDNVMKKLCGLENTEGVQVVAEVDVPQQVNLDTSDTQVHRLLALESLQDPGNLGTLLRTAVAFGWDACFLLPGCCDAFNDKALKAGRGAAFKLPLAQGNWQDLQRIVQQHNMQCLGACPDLDKQLKAKLDWDLADSKDDIQHKPASEQSDPHKAVCLVLGSEGQGLSSEAMQQIKPVSIPMPGPMESLNVSQAGAILMFALSRTAKDFVQQF